ARARSGARRILAETCARARRDRVPSGASQEPHAGRTIGNRKLEAASLPAEHVARDDADLLLFEPSKREIDIAFAEVQGVRQRLHHAGPAENARLQVLERAAEAQQAREQDVERPLAVALGALVGGGP